MDKITTYFRDTAAELRQVAWPTPRQALSYTALVIGVSALVAIFIGAFDYLFSLGINSIVNSF